MSEWIKMKDREPPSNARILMFGATPYDAQDIFVGFVGSNGMWCSCQFGRAVKPTHWMMLPPYPVAGEQEEAAQ